MGILFCVGRAPADREVSIKDSGFTRTGLVGTVQRDNRERFLVLFVLIEQYPVLESGPGIRIRIRTRNQDQESLSAPSIDCLHKSGASS